jgi:hypothetical protein
MKTRPIRGSGGNDLPLEDKLAIDRTFLANEETLLAYLRTGAALRSPGYCSCFSCIKAAFGQSELPALELESSPASLAQHDTGG